MLEIPRFFSLVYFAIMLRELVEGMKVKGVDIHIGERYSNVK